jgi:hypothetical protein
MIFAFIFVFLFLLPYIYPVIAQEKKYKLVLYIKLTQKKLRDTLNIG